MEIEKLADDIVEALVRRAEDDPGMSFDDVQRLLVLRVRTEARQSGVGSRALMSAVWHAWERRNRPSILGEGESYRIVDGLVAKGILVREDRPNSTPVIRWGGLTQAEVEARLDTLTHEEQLFVRGVLRYLEKYGSGTK